MSFRNANLDFYDRTAWWLGTTEINERDRQRASFVDALGVCPLRVLELGAGFGGTAAATADLGHHVVALELSSTRIAFARRHAWTKRRGVLEVLQVDFNRVVLNQSFDVVAYWSGFGVGDDLAQLILLRRIHQWLKVGGLAVIDIFDPIWWARANGTYELKNGICQQLGYDQLSRRLSVTRWPEGRASAAVTEAVRCYTFDEIVEMAANARLAVANTRPDIAGHHGVRYLVELEKRS
jgi:SAM-dependent methyltransferase